MARRTEVEEPDGTVWRADDRTTWCFACAHCAHFIECANGDLGTVWSRGVEHLKFNHGIVRSYVPRLDQQSKAFVQMAFDILFDAQTKHQERVLRGPRPNGE